ncbi:MAG TPA: hypothetical protein P5110_07655 [Candidatus Omnitrophota bacterium]|nr:hypothetical protein [Candidatus Omnitrophota bacterium]
MTAEDHALRPACATFQGNMEARMEGAEKRVTTIEDHMWAIGIGIFMAVIGIGAQIFISLFRIHL